VLTHRKLYNCNFSPPVHFCRAPRYRGVRKLYSVSCREQVISETRCNRRIKPLYTYSPG
jgi:hypothetical protein